MGIERDRPLSRTEERRQPALPGRYRDALRRGTLDGLAGNCVLPALRPLFIELIRTPLANRDAAVISKAETLSLAAAQVLDARLSDRTFLAGDSFSIGDIPAATTVHRWYALDIHHPELPNLHRWYDLMKQRRPFQEVVMTPLS